MLVEKSYNNLLLTNEEGEEKVVTGKGLAFYSRPGEVLDATKMEKTFWIQKENDLKQYETLLKELPKMYFDLAEQIFEKAGNTADNPRKARLLIGLADHMAYAVVRHKQGISYQNRLLWELKAFYPQEFSIGLWAIELLNQRLSIQMPEEEAGNIACHIINAQTENLEIKDTIQSIQMLKDILRIIKTSFSGKRLRGNPQYFNMVIHLQYFLGRVLEKKMLPSKKAMMIGHYIKNYTDEYRCVLKITSYVENKLEIKITDGEKFYILLQIARSTIPIG